MKAVLTSFVAGGLFAVGLAVAGMTNPAKVIGFLDLFGAWDASLALVMVAAIGVYFPLYRILARRASPLFATRFELPTREDIDGRLIFGAALFGVGWGIGGYCPGPGLVSAGSGSLAGIGFVISMAFGMKLEQRLSR